MKKSTHIRLLASILVGFFLISAIVSESLVALRNFRQIQGITVSKEESPGYNWADLTFEEKETEEENGADASDVHSNFFFIGFIERERFTTPEFQISNLYAAPGAGGHPTQLPLYLATRSLLI